MTEIFVSSVSDLTKQLMTISSGMIALSITFLNDIFKSSPTNRNWALKACWLFYLMTIVFGFWTLMGLTGGVSRLMSDPNADGAFEMNVKFPAFLQILSFLLGTVFLIIFGIRSLNFLSNKESAVSQPLDEKVPEDSPS